MDKRGGNGFGKLLSSCRTLGSLELDCHAAAPKSRNNISQQNVASIQHMQLFEYRELRRTGHVSYD